MWLSSKHDPGPPGSALLLRARRAEARLRPGRAAPPILYFLAVHSPTQSRKV